MIKMRKPIEDEGWDVGSGSGTILQKIFVKTVSIPQRHEKPCDTIE
jgi:hypothetical protein